MQGLLDSLHPLWDHRRSALQCFKQCIIIEIDEHGHISYHVQDEQRRMSQIILYLLKSFKFDAIQVFHVNVGSLKNKSNKQQEYVAKLLEHCTTQNSSDGLTDEHGNVLIKSGSGVHYTFVDYKEDQKHVVAARKRIHSVERPITNTLYFMMSMSCILISWAEEFSLCPKGIEFSGNY
jgi:hypothetical protein